MSSSTSVIHHTRLGSAFIISQTSSLPISSDFVFVKQKLLRYGIQFKTEPRLNFPQSFETLSPCLTKKKFSDNGSHLQNKSTNSRTQMLSTDQTFFIIIKVKSLTSVLATLIRFCVKGIILPTYESLLTSIKVC